MLMAVTSFFNSSLGTAYSKSSEMLLLLFTCFAPHTSCSVYLSLTVFILMQACPEYCSLILQDSGKVGPFPEKNIIADRNYHFFVLAGAPAPNIWHEFRAKIPTANRSPTVVSLPSDIFILYMNDVNLPSFGIPSSSIRRRCHIFLIIIQSF